MSDSSASGHTPNETVIEHRLDQEVIWRSSRGDDLCYHYITDRHKPFMHPLRVGTSSVLTALEPADHPWHRGVWFAWKFLNGVNFWEEEQHAGEDASAGFGSTIFAGIDEMSWQPGRTHITTHYDYRLPTGGIPLRERRTITVANPPASRWVIDWDAAFTAEEPVRLDRTIICEETPWGGYAGLSYRAIESWQDVHGLDSEGRRDKAIEHQRARWVQISGVDVAGQRSALAMLDHPENPRYPSHWRYIDDPGFFYINPSLVLVEPYDLATGEVLRLRYRIIVTDGSLDGAALDAQHLAFVKGGEAPAWTARTEV